MNARAIPGVYREYVVQAPASPPSTGVPAILGYRALESAASFASASFSQWAEFQRFVSAIAKPENRPDEYLMGAVQGFFACGGQQCWVGMLDAKNPDSAWPSALAWLLDLEDADLVCAPSLLSETVPVQAGVASVQAQILDVCRQRGDCLAILDARSASMVDALLAAVPDRDWLCNGAVYSPWIRTDAASRFLPPSGHVAGIYSLTDRSVGPHGAPANQALANVVELETQKTPHPAANPLLALPGRGILVWGARTLARPPSSGQPPSPWSWIGIRRLFLSTARWLALTTTWAAFEPNDLRLWTKLTRQLQSYFIELYNHGALKGSSAAEAFYIKCDDETNPQAVRDAGQVVVELGFAPAFPAEFIRVRLTQAATGTTISASG